MMFRRLRISRVALVVAGTPFALCLTPRDAHATTINVNTFAWNLANDGKCSLPEAVLAINNQKPEYDCKTGGNGNNDTIQLQNNSNGLAVCGAGSTEYCAVAGMPLTLSKNMTILGYGTNSVSGEPETTIQANGLTNAD